MGMKEWWEKVKTFWFEPDGEKKEQETEIKSEEPSEPEPQMKESVISFRDIQKSVSSISSSADAVSHVQHTLELRGVKTIERIKIDAGTWHAYILHTPKTSYLVTFKTNWLWNFGKMFSRPETEGTGLNLHLAKYCQMNGINTLLIVRGDGMIYNVGISELIDYAVTHNTIRAEKESYEAHIPTTILKLFTIKTEV